MNENQNTNTTPRHYYSYISLASLLLLAILHVIIAFDDGEGDVALGLVIVGLYWLAPFISFAFGVLWLIDIKQKSTKTKPTETKSPRTYAHAFPLSLSLSLFWPIQTILVESSGVPGGAGGVAGFGIVPFMLIGIVLTPFAYLYGILYILKNPSINKRIFAISGLCLLTILIPYAISLM